MQFDFSDDQKALGGVLRRLLAEQCPPSVVRQVMAGDDSVARDLWETVSQGGYLAAAIPEAFGGAGLGYLELCIVAMECGRAIAPLPTTSSIYQAAELLILAGSEDQRRQWLPRIASGEAIGTVAISERPGTIAVDQLETRLADGRIDGVKIPVVDGMAANFVIVLARSETGGPTLVLVDLAGADIDRTPVKVIDPSRKAARICFSGAHAPMLGGDGQGLALLDAARDRAAVLIAFEQIGGGEAAMLMARDYALERHAFGRPIGSFQAIKHMLADMYVAVEIARANAYYAAWALSSGSDRLAGAAAIARLAATHAYQLSSAGNIQIHGGMGFTWEFDCHLHFRRSSHLALALGGSARWEQRAIDHFVVQSETSE